MNYDVVPYVNYMNVKISNISYQNVINILLNVINNRQKGYICLNDVSNIIAATKDEELQNAINASLISIADGMPLAWYTKLIGCKEIERISGVCLMNSLFADIDGCKHYLLGDTEQTINRVMIEARKLNNKIDICGHSPPFKVFNDEDNQQIMEKIKKADPDIIWVSFGGRKQEKWMYQNIDCLDRGVMIGAGAAFRWLIGDIITPPQIFQNMGLQWLFRLTHEFTKNPRTWFKTVRERQLLSSKMVFLANLPSEVKSAREQFKLGKV